jgi:hypothetical protein
MSTLVRELVGLGTAAILLMAAIPIDRLIRKLLTGAAVVGAWRNEGRG